MSTTNAARIARSPLALALAALLSMPALTVAAGDGGNRVYVTSCADDGSAGTLRSVVDAAQNGDTIDLTRLECSRITLEQGEIGGGNSSSLTFEGPGRDLLAIDAAGSSRVFSIGGPITISGLTITGGHVEGDNASGGCIAAFAGVTLQSANVVACSVHGDNANGGAIATQYFVHIVDSTVSDNSATSDTGVALGGAIMVSYGLFTAETSTISANVASGALGSYGGGVHVEGPATITRSTIDHNSADEGGGIYKQRGLFGAGDVDIVDSTISGNTAAQRGGGMLANSTPYLTIMNSTIALNSSDDVGGVLLDGECTEYCVVNVTSAIIANNESAGTVRSADIDTTLDAQQVITLGDGDIFTSIGRIVPFDYALEDPLIGPLADNGGPTQTHALQLNSPAIDAGGNPLGLAVDQRGRARVAGLATDIGACEMQPDALFADGFDAPG
jgi:hypothetical protein